MNLAQMKTALETSVKNVLTNSLEKDTQVSVSYDANNGGLGILLRKDNEKKDNQSSFTVYSMYFKEEGQELTISAFTRTYIYDSLGIATVISDPVGLNDSFISNIKYIITVGIDMVYNPDKYKEPESKEAEVVENNENNENNESDINKVAD